MGRARTGLPAGFGASGDDSGCPILHVDMDAFFASVEVRRRPELRGQPVVVGGAGPRGVVCSASYEARAFGVRSAMPGARPGALCPQAVFLPAGHGRLRRGVARGDGGLPRRHAAGRAAVGRRGVPRRGRRPAAVRPRRPRSRGRSARRVADEQGLTCSVGVAPTKFLAKLGSTRAKPDGLLVVPAGRVLEFLHPLPVVGAVGRGRAHRRGAAPARPAHGRRRGRRRRSACCARRVGEAAGRAPARAGLGPRPARGQHRRGWRSRSAPRRPSTSTSSDADGDPPRRCWRWRSRSRARLRAAGQAGRTVAIKVRLRRLPDDSTVPHAPAADRRGPRDLRRPPGSCSRRSPPAAADPAGGRAAGGAGRRARRRRSQLTLGEPEHGWREAERAADAAAARFGRECGRQPAASAESERPAHRTVDRAER